MATPPDTVKSPPETGPESPTTARPLEMDDDDVQESGILGEDNAPKPATTAPTTAAATTADGSEEVPPPQPPRPVSEQQQHVQMLREAFPTVDLAVVKAILTASGGRIEQAFNALLQMTDPDAAQTEEEHPPPPPPRPAVAAAPTTQLEADELYARQLAEHYQNVGEYEARTSSRGQGAPRQRQQTGLKPNEMYDREHSFLDDDLPVIRENLRKGFQETQTKVNTWFTNFKKKLDEQFDENENDEHTQGAGGAFAGRPSRDPNRRSADYDRYDADPELLSDDFAGMKFNSDGTPAQRQQGYANPNRFQPPPPSKSPKPNDGRKVAFSETVDNIDAYDASPRLAAKDSASPAGSASKTSKWQPLTPVDPVAENDPFILGDSEDEKDAKEKPANKDTNTEDSERLKKAAAEAMSDSLVDEKPKTGGGSD